MLYVNPQVQSVIRWITSSGTQFGREQEDDENGILGCQGGVKAPIRPPIKPNHPPPSTEIPSDRFQFKLILIRFPAPRNCCLLVVDCC
eukprot:scaffold43404_cov48-Cyclotella_meneghiniana.AAC.1